MCISAAGPPDPERSRPCRHVLDAGMARAAQGVALRLPGIRPQKGLEDPPRFRQRVGGVPTAPCSASPRHVLALGARHGPARSSANRTETKWPSCHKLQGEPVIADEPTTAIATGVLMATAERRFSMVHVIDTGGSDTRSVTLGTDRRVTRTPRFGPGPRKADIQLRAKGEVDVLQLSRPACVPAPSPWLPRNSTDHGLGYQAVLHPRHTYGRRSRRPCRDGRCGLGQCGRAASHRFGGNRSGRPEIGTGLFIPVLLGLQRHGSCRVRIPQRDRRRGLSRPCRSLADVGENVSADRDGHSGPAPPRRLHGPHRIGQFAPHGGGLRASRACALPSPTPRQPAGVPEEVPSPRTA